MTRLPQARKPIQLTIIRLLGVDTKSRYLRLPPILGIMNHQRLWKISSEHLLHRLPIKTIPPHLAPTPAPMTPTWIYLNSHLKSSNEVNHSLLMTPMTRPSMIQDHPRKWPLTLFLNPVTTFISSPINNPHTLIRTIQTNSICTTKDLILMTTNPTPHSIPTIRLITTNLEDQLTMPLLLPWISST